jgi:choline dehydrogenase-like flavoprotein
MSSTNGTKSAASASLASLDEFLGKTYDYVICGGGTAGLVLPARLTENPDVSVGVLEAGGYKKDDPQVDTPAAFPTMFGDDNYDRKFRTTPQVRLRPEWHEVC